MFRTRIDDDAQEGFGGSTPIIHPPVSNPHVNLTDISLVIVVLAVVLVSFFSVRSRL